MNIGEVVKGIFTFLFEDIIESVLHPFLKLMETVALSPDTLAKMAWVESMYPVMIAIGTALCLLITMWQGLKSMFLGVGIEADEPVHIAVKSFIGFFLVYYIKDILLLCVNMGSTFIQMITDHFTSIPGSDWGLYGILANIFSGDLICGILTIFLVFKCIGLFWRMFKRLALCAFLILCSPLAAACMVAKPTAGFWQGFIKVLTGNFAIQIIQSVCFVVIQLSVSQLAESQASGPVTGGVMSVFNILLAIGIVDVASNLEDIIRDMSFGIGIGRDMQGAFGKIQSAAIASNYATSALSKLSGR